MSHPAKIRKRCRELLTTTELSFRDVAAQLNFEFSDLEITDVCVGSWARSWEIEPQKTIKRRIWRRRVEAAIRSRAEGESWASIARGLGCNPTTIQWHRRRMGLL